MSLSALGTGLSGMQSYQRAVDISANNVANMQTGGFVAQQPVFQENGGAGVSVAVGSAAATGATAGATVGASDSGTASSTDPANEIVAQLTYQFGFDLSAKVVQTSDRMLGTLIDTKA